MKGLIFEIQRYSIHDGPGIRSTVFLKGCPLRCLWCSNPESQLPYAELLFNKLKCVQSCAKCCAKCAFKAITKNKNGMCINRNKCTSCGHCIEACYAEALTLIGEYVTAEQVLEEIKKDTAFYEKSRGGVTISGGEPLLQHEFTGEALKLCKKEGIHTALNTSGYGKWEHLKQILRYTDLVLYDIKHMNSVVHRKYTGVPNKIILRNALNVSKEGISMMIRIPIIPTINDSKENVTYLVEFIERLKAVEEVNLLPYHRLGIPKYEMLGRRYALNNLQPPDENVLSNIEAQLKKSGFEVRIII